MKFTIDGLEQVNAENPRVTEHRLHDGSILPIVVPPSRNGVIPQETHEAGQPVRRAGSALADLDKARRAATKDATLSELGREVKVKPAREIALATVAAAEAEIAHMESATAALSSDAFAPPKLETSDLEGALIDQEIRAYARTLTNKQSTEYMKSLQGNTRHIAALMRSPVPIPTLSDYAKQLWTDSLKDSPKVVRARGYSDAIEWARQSLNSIKAKV